MNLLSVPPGLKTSLVAIVFSFQSMMAAFPQSSEMKPANPGPWGELEYTYIFLEAPDRLIEQINQTGEITVWHFPGWKKLQLSEFLIRAGMDPGHVEMTLQQSLRDPGSPSCRLLPTDSVVRALSIQTRQFLYDELARHSENRNQRYPIVIESGNVEEWFRGSGLRPELVSLIDDLSYFKSNVLVFSDIPVVIAATLSDREERTMLKALTRSRSVYLQLRVTSQTDFEALTDYWTRGGRFDEFRPLLETLPYRKTGATVDVRNLLPRMPRKQLYRYSNLSMGMDGVYPDSFWAAFNFFYHKEDDQFHRADYVNAYLKTYYSPVEKPSQFGDLLLVNDLETGTVRHACIWIADDFVFAKDGRSLLEPFKLIKFPDLLRRLSVSSPKHGASVWRRNTLNHP